MLYLKIFILYAVATILVKSQIASNNGIASISNPIYLNTQRYELSIINDTGNYMNDQWQTTVDANKIISCTVHQPLLCIYAEPPQETQQQEPSTLLIIHDEILNDFHIDDHWHTIKYIAPSSSSPYASNRRQLMRVYRRRSRRRRPSIRGPRGARGPRGRRGRSGVPIIRRFIHTVKRKLRKLRRRNLRRLCGMTGPCGGGMGMGMGMNPMGMMPMMPMGGSYPMAMGGGGMHPMHMMNGAHPMNSMMMPNPGMPPKIEIKTEVHKHSRRLIEDEQDNQDMVVAEKCVLNKEVEICLWYDMEDMKVLVDYTQIKGGGDRMGDNDEVDYVEKFEWVLSKTMVMEEEIDECQDNLGEEIGFDAVCIQKWSVDDGEIQLMVKDGMKEMEFSLIDDKDWNEIYFVNGDGQKLCRFVSGNKLCVEFSIDIEFNAIKEIKTISIEHSL